MRSACYIKSLACDHIQSVGLRDDIEIPGDKPGPVGRKSQFWHPWSTSHKANYEGKSSRFKLLCRRWCALGTSPTATSSASGQRICRTGV
jgi:hypothetical protein